VIIVYSIITARYSEKIICRIQLIQCLVSVNFGAKGSVWVFTSLDNIEALCLEEESANFAQTVFRVRAVLRS
jgi:hypothetical protein